VKPARRFGYPARALKAFFRRQLPVPELSVLMVCLGNICRSPTAEGVLRTKLERLGLHERVRVESAGTHGEKGGAPDARAVAAAAKRGYDLSRIRSRRVVSAELAAYDLVLAMDSDNLAFLREACPRELQGRLRLLLREDGAPDDGRDVPDPYYGGPAGFEHVLDLIEAACDKLAQDLRARLGTS
jgi:protein-tyrosine phosphatase